MEPPIPNPFSGITEPLLQPQQPNNSTAQEQNERLLANQIQPQRCRMVAVCLLAMVILWVGALATALGQHFFYISIDGSEIHSGLSQAWVVRLGVAFGFIFKTLLVGAVSVIYAQALWFWVQRRAIRVESLDAIFGVLNNPTLFFNRELIQKTPFLFSVALISWTIPISAVIAPGALTGHNCALE